MKTQLKSIFTHINNHPKFSQYGNVSLRNDECSVEEMREECGIDIKEGDLVVYYDYCSDEIYDDVDKVNELVEWLYDDKRGCWGLIRGVLYGSGYEEIGENDGSGGGLYYGVSVFRKK